MVLLSVVAVVVVVLLTVVVVVVLLAVVRDVVEVLSRRPVVVVGDLSHSHTLTWHLHSSLHLPEAGSVGDWGTRTGRCCCPSRVQISSC